LEPDLPSTKATHLEIVLKLLFSTPWKEKLETQILEHLGLNERKTGILK
jgi:hypothetical protein